MKNIGQLVREAAREGGRRPLRPADDFWREFRRQAAALPQTGAAPVKTGVSRGKLWIGLAGPAVAIAATLVAVFWSGPRDLASHDAVQSYRIGEDVVHGGVMILNDEPSRATILWIADLADNA